jgi:hypothetical protein
MRIFLEFVPSQETVHRLRLTYAFRLFCAIWNHDPVLDPADQASCEAKITYSSQSASRTAKYALRLSNLYQPRVPRLPAPPPSIASYGGEEIPLFYAPRQGESPDWLAEIFEWVSCADEYSIREFDPAGRIPFSSSYVGRHSLDVRRPYAAIAMRLLHISLQSVPEHVDRNPESLTTSGEHFIINTHDVDYLPLSRTGSIKRLLKNAAASAILFRAPRLALSQAKAAFKQTFSSRDLLDQLPGLMEEEKRRSIEASYYFITVREHRRDANYEITDRRVLQLMNNVAESAEVGVHGSYTSLDHDRQLKHEFDRLRGMGFRPSGGRQHWLRFTLDRLIPEVERAGIDYDCSLGWSDKIGFRAGACFAFPPYDFAHERPARFLEFPLVMMDQALLATDIRAKGMAQSAASLLAASRSYGWGGISVLWHPAAFGGGQLSEEVGQAFYHLLGLRARTNDVWTSGEHFLNMSEERFRRVGLLETTMVGTNHSQVALKAC